jgi:hypothetical protein
MLWMDAAQFAISVIVLIVGDGADRGDLISEIARPTLGGIHDFVLAYSICGERELRAMSWTVGFGTGVRHGKPYCDTCAIRRGALKRLALREMTCGWNSEMQMHAPQIRANSV